MENADAFPIPFDHDRDDAPAKGASRSVVELQERLRERLKRPVVVVLTDNRQRLFSCAWRGGVAVLRVQRRFLEAPPAVVDALADLAADVEGEAVEHARFTVRAWWRSVESAPDHDAGQAGAGSGIVDAGAASRPGSAPNPTGEAGGASSDESSRVNVVGVTALGRFHDLALYGHHLNETYLGGRSKSAIRWGARVRRRAPTRTIRLGCFFPGQRRIVMNRRLDRAEVPRYFVEYVLFHEMLHEVLGIGERPDGRREIHGRLFKLMERTYPEVDRALAFERRFFGG